LIEAVLVMQNGERIVLETDSLKIGRQATCRIVFNDSNVSREHAQMRRTADGWKLLDLGSTNGTKINGVKITEEQLLVNGDDLSFGTSSAKFEIS
jgi:pSer/pThr/pTyr-binding forkhead associated (FHA) protein